MAMDPEQIWREKSDEDLVEAGERLFEFTTEGEQIIRAELRRRGLPDPPAPTEYCSRCGHGIYGGGPTDACENCGEPLAEAVRVRLAEADEPLLTEVVYRSRFAHEIELVTSQLAGAGIVASPGARGLGAHVRYLEIPALQLSQYTVVVAASDATRAREIIEGLPVSHGDDEETQPPPPLDEP